MLCARPFTQVNTLTGLGLVLARHFVWLGLSWLSVWLGLAFGLAWLSFGLAFGLAWLWCA